MALFTKKAVAPAPEPKGGGMDVIRARVRAQVRWPQSHAIFARELHLSGDAINSFVAGADNLSSEQISAVLDYLGMRATYDADVDLLVSTAAPPTSMGVGPSPWTGGSNIPGFVERPPGVYPARPFRGRLATRVSRRCPRGLAGRSCFARG